MCRDSLSNVTNKKKEISKCIKIKESNLILLGKTIFCSITKTQEGKLSTRSTYFLRTQTMIAKVTSQLYEAV